MINQAHDNYRSVPQGIRPAPSLPSGLLGALSMGAEAKSNKAPSLPHVPSGLSGILGYSSGAYNSSANPILREN